MKRLLFIAHRVPFPPDKGERVRAFHEILALREQFEVTVAAPVHSPSEFEAAELLGQEVHDVLLAPAGGKGGLVRGLGSLLGGRSVTEGYFHSPKLRRLLQDASRNRPFDLVMAYCSSMLPYATALPARARVMDLVDVDSAKWASYADRAMWPKSWLYRTEARRVAGLERRCVRECDAVLLVSDAEAEAMGLASEKLLGLPNGVDIQYFHPTERPADAPPSIVFTGTMDYRPNVEGVCWFADQVLPALRREVSDLTLVVVGRDPAPALRKLGERDGIAVTGSVPDVRPYFTAAAAAVVPLRIARGIQNKVLEAMAAGRAVVASPGAIEGIDARADTHLLRAETPDEWVRQVLSLLRDPARREALERAARRRVEERYNWPARMAPLVDLALRLSQDT